MLTDENAIEVHEPVKLDADVATAETLVVAEPPPAETAETTTT